MLQKLELEDDFGVPQDADRSYLLHPAYYWDLIARRWVYFIVPFFVVACIGVGGALLWPATYLSEGKILVQSQQIPAELVRPTVTSAAQERIQVIEQRTMTRDNLVAVVDKYHLFPDKRNLMSVTDLITAMKKQTKIAAVDLQLDFKQRTQQNPTIVFSVGFEYSDPVIASNVANELMTRILSEDLRDRTSRATDTTQFLSREVQKLQADNATLDARIAQLRLSQDKPSGATGSDPQASALAQLKAELVQKSALYSDSHPVIQSLKRQVAAMEKAVSPSAEKADASANATLEQLLAQQDSLQKNLDDASTKLTAAQLGENLEKAQQSEKLEILEQPTVNSQPIRPNRPKVMALAVIFAFAVGAGLVFLMEISDKAIRRSSDIFCVVDSQLIVPIPYIVTSAELRQRKRRVIFAALTGVALMTGVVILFLVFLPPLDLIIAKARVGLFQ